MAKGLRLTRVRTFATFAAVPFWNIAIRRRDVFVCLGRLVTRTKKDEDKRLLFFPEAQGSGWF